MSKNRKSFLRPGSCGGNNFDDFDSVTPSGGFSPIPNGSYLMVATAGKVTPAEQSSNGSAYYAVTFKVHEGEHKGRLVWDNMYWTEAAKPYTREKLRELKITSSKQINSPFPADRMLFKVNVAVRARDDGTETNDVKSFKFVRDIEPEVDPFAPPTDGGGNQP